jgi:hypothetical protein
VQSYACEHHPGNDLFEILEKEQAGYCPLNGNDGFCAAALRLANDPELRVRMGNSSRGLLERLFSVDAAVSQIIEQFPEKATLAEGTTAMQAVIPSKLSAGRI